MSTQTDFESLRQQIVDVVTKDPTIKYTLLGWFNEEFVPKAEYHHLLEELRTMREHSDQRFEAADKRFDAADKRFDAIQQEIKELREDANKRFEAADKRFEAVDKRFEAVDKRFEEAAAERKQMRKDTNKRFDAMQQEMHQGFERQERYSKILAAKIDKLGGRWGIQAETAFRQGMSSIVQELFDGVVSKWETEDTEGCVYGHVCRVELDIVIRNGTCIVAEIKSQVNRAEVAAFHRIVKLYQEQTGTTPDRKVLIAADIDDTARELAQKLDIEVFPILDETEVA